MSMSRLVATAALLAIASAAAPQTAVCDGAWGAKVPCFSLKTGNKLPQVAMGSWGGSYKNCASAAWGCYQDSARFAVESWLRLGATHVDGANDYRTQVAIAEALRASDPQRKREEIFITTKCPGAIGYEAMMQCADDNLQMLGQFTDSGPGYIDLLLIHFPFTVKPACRFNKNLPECSTPWLPATAQQLQDTWKAMEDLKRIGVVRSIGVSDYNTTQLQQTLDTAHEPIEVNQVEWNPLTHDEGMLKFCQANGIQLQAWSPLGGAKGSVLAEPPIVAAATAHKVSSAQVALRWSLQRSVAVVVGTADAAHAAGDLDIFSFQLTDAEMSSINALGDAKGEMLV